ncbi:glycosyl hydrolase family 65 protein, partial [Muricauda sp. ANG21]|uniref:glycosyl hydrolase family 65 protein n=1 Tax=Allomuricauda sp. ANG21 TaxID=3042468 RepID=UPI00345113C3
WMSIVEGFAGMRVLDGRLSFNPQIPKQWKSYSFKVNFRGEIVRVRVDRDGIDVETNGHKVTDIDLNGSIKKVIKKTHELV